MANVDILSGMKKLAASLRGDARALNKIKNDDEFRRGAVMLKSLPVNYVIGLTNICNLSCPLCITGLRRQQKPLKYMEMALFREIIDKIKDHAYLVQLYNWGESLLHRDIIEIFEYCGRFDLNTEISSNLSLSDVDDRLDAMVKHRLKRLIVSFDGVNQEDYERYRFGGDFESVLRNIGKIREYKKFYKSEYPRISLQYLRNKFTKGQVEVIKEKHREWGADDYYVCDMTTIFKDRDMEKNRRWFEGDEIERRRFLDIDTAMHGKRCCFLYTTMVIEQDGTIPPCCFATDPNDDFGVWDGKKSLSEMFNSEKFIKARQAFNERRPLPGLTCSNCSVFITYCSGLNR